ncbi:hypothetical protein CCL11_00200 [Pseudomonas syringae]|nr:hypothetical protein CCL11_00200 [Pseudomonas syringae]
MTGWLGKLAASNLRWNANPNTGDNKALVHEGVTMLGAEERSILSRPAWRDGLSLCEAMRRRAGLLIGAGW